MNTHFRDLREQDISGPTRVVFYNVVGLNMTMGLTARAAPLCSPSETSLGPVRGSSHIFMRSALATPA